MPTLDTFRPEPGSLPTRDVIPDRYKWDLTSICATWDDWSTGYKRLDEAIAATDLKLSSDEVKFLGEAYRPHPVLGHG